jgi:uncharacterized protein YjbI with pentapeptide repeats
MFKKFQRYIKFIFFFPIKLGIASMLGSYPALAQDMLQGVDLEQPAYSQAELTRTDIEKAIINHATGAPLDFSRKSLNGLDLSGLNLSGCNFYAARLNKTDLNNTNLEGAILDQAWLIEANLTNASLKGAHAFATQMQRIRADKANFSGIRLTADLTGASLRETIFNESDLSADMKNQSMGLMRANLRSTRLEGASFKKANLMSADLRFAHAARTNFTEANLSDANAAGADFSGAVWKDARVTNLDLDSALIDSDSLSVLQNALHLDRVQKK